MEINDEDIHSRIDVVFQLYIIECVTFAFICHMPYADSGAPELPAHSHSLIWELHWPLINKIESHWLIRRHSSSQIRLRGCTGWSGATLSTYDILPSRVRVDFHGFNASLLIVDCLEKLVSHNCKNRSFAIIDITAPNRPCPSAHSDLRATLSADKSIRPYVTE